MKFHGLFGAVFLLAAYGILPAMALDLVKDGRPASTILLPQAPTKYEQEAAAALKGYIQRASKVALGVANEPARPQGTIISVGHTELATTAGINDADLVYDGYHLRSQGNVLFILGRDVPPVNASSPYWFGARGTQAGVLGMLQRMGFRWIMPGEQGVYFPDLVGKTVQVPDDLNVTYRPPLAYAFPRFDRYGDWSLVHGWRNAMRFYSLSGHTWQEYVPASLWDTHPEYFAMDGNGGRVKPKGGNHFLCPSQPDVVRLLADSIRKRFDEGYDVVELGQSDGCIPCYCPLCRALGEGFEFEQIHVCHAKVIQELYKSHPSKKVMLHLYGPAAAPTRLVKSYPPNVIFELANAKLEDWSDKVSGGFTKVFWYFGSWHTSGLGPKQSPQFMAGEMKKLMGQGLFGIYWCGGTENWGADGPVYYIIGELQSDPALDWRPLMREYCQLLYGKAGATMERYYGELYSRALPNDRAGLHNEYYVRRFPVGVLERCGELLALAKQQAQGDPRALNWLRLAEISFRQADLTARVCHLYAAYEANRTMPNLMQVRDAVASYRAFADDTAGLGKSDPAFVRDYFPAYEIYWKDAIKTNAGQFGSPFKWDFDAIVRANVLPGKDRPAMVIARLAVAPAVDGKADDAAWRGVKPITLLEGSMGAVAAETRFRAGYDDQKLYVAFECDEPLIEKMEVRKFERDQPVWRTECVELLLDPFADGRRLMHFIVTPSETGYYDARRGYIADPLHPLVVTNQSDSGWNPSWTRAFTIDKEKKVWRVEMALPFSSLEVDTPVQGARWRMNFIRERVPASFGGNGFPENYMWSPNLQKADNLDQTVFGDAFFGAAPK